MLEPENWLVLITLEEDYRRFFWGPTSTKSKLSHSSSRLEMYFISLAANCVNSQPPYIPIKIQFLHNFIPKNSYLFVLMEMIGEL